METVRQLWHNRALMTFMLGHFTVDLYGGLLPVLYPLMALEFNLSMRDVGLIAFCYTAAGSLSQPVFGYIADRFGSRVLAPLSLIWAAGMFAIIGLSPSHGFLMVAAFMAGLGSGAYHPLGAANASAASGEMRKNTAMSIYTVGGTFGFALGPVLGVLLFGLLGREGSVVMIPLGILAAILVTRSFRQLGLGLPAVRAQARGAAEAIQWRPLLTVMSVVMARSWAFMALVTFIPLWYQEMGYGPAFYGPLTTLVIAFGSVGTVLGGVLADRVGERRVLTLSLAASIPPLLLFVNVTGPLALLSGPLFGLLADMSLSPTLVMAQRLLPGRVGMASGLILGLGFVTGGIGVPITGYLADHVGTPAALMSLSLLVGLAIGAALLIPRQAFTPRQATLRPAPSQAD